MRIYERDVQYRTGGFYLGAVLASNYFLLVDARGSRSWESLSSLVGVCAQASRPRGSPRSVLVMDVVVLDIKRSARLPPARPQMPRQIKNRPLEI
jgi:hypothetical protein